MNLQGKKLNIITSCYSNLNCSQCYVDSYIPIVPTKFNIRRLHSIFTFFKEKGVSAASIIGGEPLMNSFLLLQTVSIASKYFEHISLLTNGILLDSFTLDRLIESGLKQIKFSVLSVNELRYRQLSGLLKEITLPIDIMKEAKSKLDTILYIPLFPDNAMYEIEEFDGLCEQTGIKQVTFLSTVTNQFHDMEFYKNISKTAVLVRKEEHLEIYNTNKYSIGFLDIVSYVNMEGRYYLYPDLQIRSSLRYSDSIVEI